MNNDIDFNKWQDTYIRKCARTQATCRYLAALQRGHSEEYAKKLAHETYAEYLQRNLE